MTKLRHIGVDRDMHIVDVDDERRLVTEAEWLELLAQDQANGANTSGSD